ncbi:alpha/beta hydrolase [Arthrobacter livingstonensis]|uniref:Alpha/beta hydrolase n=2 Tax=Arthrobacter livingstonensis TaxID=670078 RepID=A0A2V5L0J2_9MICC|nr:alpha/beta hydrolase [Arthrobacter livingstonensis]
MGFLAAGSGGAAVGQQGGRGPDDGGAQPVPDPGRAFPGVPDSAEQLDAALPDLDWSQLPPGFTRSLFAAPSGPLAVVSLGDPGGPPVVLVPGATGSKEDFVLMMPILAAAGCFALSFDLAGQYESAGAGPENLAPPQRHYSYGLFTDDLVAVLRDVVARSGRPAHVVGYSFAGTVAGLAHATDPGLFASLTLLGCPPLAGQSFRGISRIGPLTGLAGGRTGAALMIWGIKANVVPVLPGRLRFVRDRFRLTRRQSVRDIVELMQRSPDLAAVLAGAALPKLVAVGEHDLWPTRLHAAFAASIGASLSVYRSGHSPGETSPNQLCRDLLALFARAA